jgi:Flp pilus assembly protein TadG
MRFQFIGCRLSSLRARPLAALRSNEDGSTAIEFGLLALPFFFFVLGLLGIGLFYLSSVSLSYGVEAAARQIRTGEAEKNGITVAQFKQLVCQNVGGPIDCTKMSTLIQSKGTWGEITPAPCTDDQGDMVESTGKDTDALSKYSGTASSVVLVTLCYRWDMAEYFPFLKLGYNGGSGPAIIQAATAFKNEPYNGAG